MPRDNPRCLICFRIRDVIGKACIKTWAKKRYSNFMDYRKRISECICKVCDEIDQKIKRNSHIVVVDYESVLYNYMILIL